MSIKEWIYFNKKKIFIFVFGLIVVVLGSCYYYLDNNEKVEDKDPIIKNDLVLEKEEIVEEVSLCFFDIKGEVKKPGVYSISCDSRINDAINLSGGLTNNSDTSVINLSKQIEDGMVIIVYSKKEVSSYLETLEKEKYKQDMCNSSNLKNDACINYDSNISNSNLININTASLDELMTLSGIGESKAKNIISYRNKTPFKNIDDILNVEGIGESIYVNIKENITV